MENIKVQQEILIEKIEEHNQPAKIRQYIKGKVIGVGGFAKCYEGVNLDSDTKVAIKVIDKSSLIKNRAKQKLLSEIKIHKMLDHQFIVRFLTVFEDLRRVYIIVELCQNKSLSEFVRRRKRLSILQIKRFMKQLIQALQYMHSLKIIHRDIKLANIFLDKEMNIKVGDFGLSAKIQYAQEKKRTMCGTPNYIAPEIIQGGSGHSYQVDLWSAGVICYTMFYGRPPFQTLDIKKTYERIKNCQFQFNEVQGLIPEFKDFIKKILVLDPKKRLTLKQMTQHPFLREQITPLIYNPMTLTPRMMISKTIIPQLDAQQTKQKHTTQQTLKQQTLQEKNTGDKKEIEWKSTGVLSYVDYSTKYGLGYMLSNSVYGVYFNDSSLLSFNIKDNMLTYIENPSIEEEKVKIGKYNFSQINNEHFLNKKYMLLKRFKFYLDEQTKKDKSLIIQIEGNEFIYVKQWLKTKHAIMFRLSNKLFQVNFFDESAITLNTELKYVLAKSKKSQVKTMTLNDARSQANTQLSRRMNYIREILNNLKQK